MEVEGEHLFVQENDEQDKYDMYTSLQTAITVRKCKVDQKREKLILLANQAKKIKEDLKLAKNGRKNLLKEKREVTHQETLRLANIKAVKESRSCLETVVCDLNNKVTFQMDEMKKNCDIYAEAMIDARETWDSYEKMYNELPMAKERQRVTLELKKVIIELKKTKMDLNDIKRKIKLKFEIKEKIHHNWAVNLAKLFFRIQEKKSEKSALLIKIRELQKQLDEMEAGKVAKTDTVVQKNIVRPVKTQEKEMTKIPKVFDFKIPELQIASPPAPTMTPTSTVSALSKWASLMGSSNLLNVLKSVGMQKESLGNKRAIEATAHEVNTHDLTKQTNNANEREKHAEERERIMEKRANIGLAENQAKQLAPTSKTPMNKMPKKKKHELDIVKTTEYNGTSAPESKMIKLMGQKNSVENVISKHSNKENIQSNKGYSSVSGIKAFMSSFIENTKGRAVTSSLKRNCELQNVSNTGLSSNQLGAQENKIESQREVSNVYMPTLVQNHSQQTSHVLESTQNYQSTPHQNSQQDVAEEDLFANEPPGKQPETVTMPMDPTSPPDVIPVESNSQPLSPTMVQTLSSKVPSQTPSDYMSPSELDEGAKLAYQRIAAESPGFVYPRGPEYTITKTTEEEMSQAAVHSQYLPNSMSSPQPPSIQSPTNQVEYQPAPYSPDRVYTNIGFNSILSPPPGNLGLFGVDKHGSSERSAEKPSNEEDNGSPGGFGFSFMSSSKKKSSSFFSLF